MIRPKGHPTESSNAEYEFILLEINLDEEPDFLQYD